MSNNVSNYGWDDNVAPESCDYIAPHILNIIKKYTPGKVLDLGCGNGSLCSLLNTNDIDIVGVDYDHEGVELAKAESPEVPFYNYGIQDDPQELLNEVDSRFDVVVSTEVIEHLYSPQLLLTYAHHCLVAKGRIIITTPYHGYLKNLALSIFNKWDDHHTVFWEGGHIKFWSRKTLTELMSRYGFEVVEFSGVGRMPYLWKSMVLVAIKK